MDDVNTMAGSEAVALADKQTDSARNRSCA